MIRPSAMTSRRSVAMAHVTMRWTSLIAKVQDDARVMSRGAKTMYTGRA